MILYLTKNELNSLGKILLMERLKMRKKKDNEVYIKFPEFAKDIDNVTQKVFNTQTKYETYKDAYHEKPIK